MTESTPETAERNALIEKHVGLVRLLAQRQLKDIPPWMERDDLISYGYFGLIDAAERFDPERGVKFESFATPRIRGAILDGLRAVDWVPRSVRSLGRDVRRATEALEHELGRTPSVTELAEHLGLAEQEVLDAQRDVHDSHIQALDPYRDNDPDRDDPSHAPSSDPAGEVDQARLLDLMSEAVVGLPADHRAVVALRYGEGLSLPDIGKRLGFGRGKATTLYVEACMMLRERLALLT